MDFSITALIESGHVVSKTDMPGIIQGLDQDQAHCMAIWLALATNTTTRLRFMSFGTSSEIVMTPAAALEHSRRPPAS